MQLANSWAKFRSLVYLIALSYPYLMCSGRRIKVPAVVDARPRGEEKKKGSPLFEQGISIYTQRQKGKAA